MKNFINLIGDRDPVGPSSHLSIIYCARYLPTPLCSTLGWVRVATRVPRNMDFVIIFTLVKRVEPASLTGMLRLNEIIYLEHLPQSQAHGVFVNIFLPQLDAAITC